MSDGLTHCHRCGRPLIGTSVCARLKSGEAAAFHPACLVSAELDGDVAKYEPARRPARKRRARR